MLTQMTPLFCLITLSSLAVSSELGLGEIFFSPVDQTTREGEGVFFQCVSGESSAPASITWLKDEKPVKRGRQFQGEYGGGNQKKTSGTLHLFNVTLEDDGMYVCITHNPSLNISKRSKPAKLTVLGVPRRLQIIQGPENITVAMRAEVSMHCAVHGFPVPMVQWFKGGFLLTNGSALFNLQDNGQLLTFRNVTKEDEGTYYCEASNEIESIRSQTAFLLLAEMDWSFREQPVNLTVKKGENVTITCRPPHSRPEAQVSWFKNNKVFAQTNHVSMLPTGDLFFNRVQEYDSGSFFCRASNVHLQRFLTSRRATLTVLAPPSVRVWPQVLTVPVGARVVLECQVSGHPLPNISWVKRGHSKETGGRISVGLKNATLYIQSARTYDEGVYACEASNTLGQSSSGATLRVAVRPIIVTYMAQVSCSPGASAVLPCRAVGIQPIIYTWTRERAGILLPISPTKDRPIDEDGSLHLSNVQSPDAGEYYCTAENRAGRHQRRIVLSITAEHHPTERGKQTTLVLSASTISKEPAVTKDSVVGQSPQTTQDPQIHTQHEETTGFPVNSDATTNKATTFLRGAVAELKMSPELFGHLMQQQQIQQTTHPTQPLATQMQPPMLPPPPHPNFQSVDLYSHLLVSSNSLFVTNNEPSVTPSLTPLATNANLQYLHTVSPSHLTMTSSNAQLQDLVIEEMLMKSNSKRVDIHNVGSSSQTIIPSTEAFASPLPLRLSENRPFGFLDSKLVSYPPSVKQSPVEQSESIHFGSVTPSSASHTELHQSQTQPNWETTKGQIFQEYHEQHATHISQINPRNTEGLQSQKTQPSATQSPESLSYHLHTPPQSVLPKFQLEASTNQHYPLSTQKSPQAAMPQPSQTQNISSSASLKPTFPISMLSQTQPQNPLLQPKAHQPQTETSPVQNKTTSIIQPSVSATYSPNQTLNSLTLDPKIPLHHGNISDQVQLNTSRLDETGQSENGTKLTEWLKRNTSQSPMTSNEPRVTQQSPSWLPVLEKHDIPIVVGVGVSLVFIFITVTFYSVVQKNDPAPTSRAAQRNLGVPMRHAERRAAGRSYENRAFEDDDCVAVIEQSPNTSETRARLPEPSLVTVQMVPTFEDIQMDTPPALDNHSVTVETYPEPMLDTKVQ